MGVRLVKYNRASTETGGSSMFNDHDELINRDMMNQHPIYAIIGLQEVLNLLEDTIQETNELLLQKENELSLKIDESVNNINSDIDVINNELTSINSAITNANVINSVIDTPSVDLTYDTVNKSLKADVKLRSETGFYNLIKEFDSGIYVPQINPVDTPSITWTKEAAGKTVKDFFSNARKFCHWPTSTLDLYTSGFNSSWITNSPTSPTDITMTASTSSYLAGIVSNDLYDFYTHQVRIYSTSSYQRYNGVVIGHIIDDTGVPHTLSVVLSRGVPSYFYAIVYDLNLPGETIIKQANLIDGTLQSNSTGYQGWNVFPFGITVKVKKFGSSVEVVTSNWGDSAIQENTRLKINLNDYAWGHLFSGPVRYGYCNGGQPTTAFTSISVSYDNLASSTLIAQTKLSADATNGLSIKSDGLYSETIKISAQTNNALIKNADGYYTESTRVSSQANNSLQKLTDGYYVRDYANIKTVTKTAHGFIEGDFIYYHPINGYALASAIDDYNSNIVGMVSKVIDANTFEYKWAGFHKTDLFSNTNGYAQGMPLYISDINPGKVVQDQPDISKTVGYPIEDTGIIISIERGIQYNQETSIGDFKQSANTYNVRSDGFIKVTEGILYKQTLVERLLNTVDDAFKASYLVLHNDDQTMEFINTEALYSANNVRTGFNLFIKAF